MKLNYKKIPAMAFALIGLALSLQAADLSDQDKQFLTAYGKAHNALVADDLAGAKKAGLDLVADGVDLSKSKPLDEGRAVLANSATKQSSSLLDKAATTSRIAR